MNATTSRGDLDLKKLFTAGIFPIISLFLFLRCAPSLAAVSATPPPMWVGMDGAWAGLVKLFALFIWNFFPYLNYEKCSMDKPLISFMEIMLDFLYYYIFTTLKI